MSILRKYGVATTIDFPLIERAGLDYMQPVTGGFTATESQIMKDEGAFANTSNSPNHEGNGYYSLALTATEMQAARIVVVIIDADTESKQWEDQSIIIDTYGNASAQHAFDLDTATQVVTISGTKTTLDALNDASLAQIESECNDALVALGLDHLVSAAVVGADVTDDSIIAQLVSKSATADWDSFVNTTDALEAIADASGAGAIAELTGDPGTTPTQSQAIMLMYMALRNASTETNTAKTIKNNAGSTILTKSIADDGATLTLGKAA